jgi:arylsulfatase A-like enzyme
MPTEQITIAEMLKASGYATAHIGKWHLGFTPETMPNGQGFGAILLCDASEGSVPHGTLPYREKRLPHQPKDRG